MKSPAYRLFPLVTMALIAACAPSPPAAAPAPDTPGSVPEPEVVAEAKDPIAPDPLLGRATYDLPIVSNLRVQDELNFLVGSRAEVIGGWMERGDFYQPWIESVLDEHGLPRDLFYMAMIESGFVPTARSHAGAVGIWQFMRPTGRMEGLRIDDDVDERIDPVRSTRAAARHLSRLYGSLGDWPLAAASYNAGMGRVTRSMERHSATDFWDLARRGDLARETRQYVPRLYAVTIVGRDRARFGFSAAPTDNSGFAFDSVRVEDATSLEALARVSSVPEDALRELNPHLLRGQTPSGPYTVWVPAGQGGLVRSAYVSSARNGRLTEAPRLAGLPSTSRSAPPPADRPETAGRGVHVVEAGETIWSIARDLGTNVGTLRQLNDLSTRAELEEGQELLLPEDY